MFAYSAVTVQGVPFFFAVVVVVLVVEAAVDVVAVVVVSVLVCEPDCCVFEVFEALRSSACGRSENEVLTAGVDGAVTFSFDK